MKILIFLVESYKSEVLIKQSLGRGMRKMEGKEKVNIIDFVDDFSSSKYVNYLMKHSCRLSEQEIVECMIQICSGLEHLHALGMAHRDIKVENILVSYSVRGSQKIKGDPVFKLGDFGSTTKDHSINFDKCDKKEIGMFMEKIEEQCTRMYRAPEMIDRWQGYNVHGVATDMWMLGCVLYVLCTGNKHPF